MSSTQTSCSLESTQSEENSGDEDENDEMLDPRVKIELDSLNSATTEINDVEQELEEMHAVFRQTLSESAFVLKTQSNILGKCVKRSRPYFEKLEYAKKLQVETQKAALNYERACSQHQAAKLAVAHAEQKLASTSTEHKTLDHTWQEMLNKAIKKVMDSELQKQQNEREHLHTAQKLTKANKEISDMKIKLKSSISKSRVYYDLRDKYMEVLEGHKEKILSLQQRLKNSKKDYSRSLRKLESISDEIHELRKSQVDLAGPRQDGVGAECSEAVNENNTKTEDNVLPPDGSAQDDDDDYVVKIDIGDDDDDEDDLNTDNSDQNGSETDDTVGCGSTLQSETAIDVDCTEHSNDRVFDPIRNDGQKQDDADDKAEIVNEIVQNNVHIDEENVDDDKGSRACLRVCNGQKESLAEQNDVGNITNGGSDKITKDEFNKEENDMNHKLKEERRKDIDYQNEQKSDIEDSENVDTDGNGQNEGSYNEESSSNNINKSEEKTDEIEQNTVGQVIDVVESNATFPESKEHTEFTNEQNESNLNEYNNSHDDVKREDSIAQNEDNKHNVQTVDNQEQHVRDGVEAVDVEQTTR